MIVVAALGLGAAETLAQRKRQVSLMSPSEKQQLLDNHQRFLALAPEERDRLRELDRAIAADENAEQLRDVMQRYHDWLMANLSPTERARLLQLESQERIAQIQRRLEYQTRRQENELSDEDIETIVDWVERRMRREWRPAIVARLSELSPSDQRLAILSRFLHLAEMPGRSQLAMPSDVELRSLAQSLSPAGRRILMSAGGPTAKRRLIEWIRIAVNREVDAGDERFARFFVEEATPEQRERLLTLPPDQMMRAMRTLYFGHKLGWPNASVPLRSSRDRAAPGNRGPRDGRRFPATDRRRPGDTQRTP